MRAGVPGRMLNIKTLLYNPHLVNLFYPRAGSLLSVEMMGGKIDTQLFQIKHPIENHTHPVGL